MAFLIILWSASGWVVQHTTTILSQLLGVKGELQKGRYLSYGKRLNMNEVYVSVISIYSLVPWKMNVTQRLIAKLILSSNPTVQILRLGRNWTTFKNASVHRRSRDAQLQITSTKLIFIRYALLLLIFLIKQTVYFNRRVFDFLMCFWVESPFTEVTAVIQNVASNFMTHVL